MGGRFGAESPSIKSHGVLEPILVQEQDKGGYVLIAGERRFRACETAGLGNVPAIALSKSLTEEKLVAIQMIENLQRENPHPITEAERYLKYFEVVMGIADVKDAITSLVNHGRRRKKTKDEYAEKISALEVISGKTSRTIQNLIRLTKLPQEAKTAIVEKKIKLSQGYILSKHTQHKKFTEVLQERLKQRMTNKDLISLLEDSQGANQDKGSKQFGKDIDQLKKIGLVIKKNKDIYENFQRKELRDEAEMIWKALDAMITDETHD